MNVSRNAFVRIRAALALAGSVATLACGTGATSSAGQRPPLRVGTAFGPFSQPLTAEYDRQLTAFEIVSVPAGDSEALIHGIEAGTIDLGVSLADEAYRAYRRALEEAGTGDSPIRGVALLQPLPQYVLVRGGSGVRTIADLRNPPHGSGTIALGPVGSSSNQLGHLVLDAFGIDPGKIVNVDTRAEAAAGLKDGTLDAVFFPGYVYPDEVVYSAVQAGAYLIPIDGPEIDRLREAHPFVRRARIPREIYEGQDRIIPTVGIDMVVVCRRDLDPAVVYQLTATLMDAYPRLSGVEATLRFLNLEEAPATPMPLHPGAARYFRARDLLP